MRKLKDIIDIKRANNNTSQNIICVNHISVWERKNHFGGFIKIGLSWKHRCFIVNEGGPYFSFSLCRSLIRLWIKPYNLECMIRWDL